MTGFLTDGDAARVWKTLQKLLGHDISGWALTGGLAVEIHYLRGGLSSSPRPLNDIDFVCATFHCVPKDLSADFLFRHVHPLDPEGKTILQLVDAGTALRVDLFRASEAIVRRASALESAFGPIQLISAEDLLAHLARLLLDLGGGVPVAAKHADDYLKLIRVIQTSDFETAWQDHRKPCHPETFRQADAVVQGLIATHSHLLITPEYCKDAAQICPRCVPAAAFPLADPHVVLSLLGYC